MSKGGSGAWMLFRKGYNEMGTDPAPHSHPPRGMEEMGGGIDFTIGLGQNGLVPAYVENKIIHGEYKVTVGISNTPLVTSPIPETIFPWGKWFASILKVFGIYY